MLFSTPSRLLIAICLTGSVSINAYALTEMDDAQLSDVEGEGLAFSLEDFRFQAAPTSYLELIGGPPPAGSSLVRGDIRYYGLTISGEGTDGHYWDDNSACTGNAAVSGDLGCPMALSSILRFAPHDNPYVLRVFDYTKVGWDGAGWSTGQTRTVFELKGPSNMNPYRWGFWGEIEVNKGGACPGGTTGTPGCSLQSQTLIWGKPTAPNNPANIVADLKTGEAAQKLNNYQGPVFQIFQNSASADNTLGLLYHSRLSGDFRFGVNKQNVGIEAIGTAPRFSTTEGVHFRNVTSYLPLGQLHYQSIILDDVAAAPGNFTIEVTRLPNDPDAYNDFYSLGGDGLNNDPDIGYTRTGRPARYYETHGYSVWGQTGTVNNTGTLGAGGTKTLDTSDGIYFYKGDISAAFTATARRPGIDDSCSTGDTGGCSAPASGPNYSYSSLNSVNLGDAAITGIQINHLKITTCSAGATAAC